jgi:hypothetical protein
LEPPQEPLLCPPVFNQPEKQKDGKKEYSHIESKLHVPHHFHELINQVHHGENLMEIAGFVNN